MVDRNQMMQMALQLMDRALEVLDEIGEQDAAFHLQQALDVARKTPIPRTVEEMEAMLATPEMQALQERLFRSNDGIGH
jgi:hypothetical protein